jgi:hypothetical protein
MPINYTCSSCGLRISTGSYHGFGNDGWFNALYCRHCGTAYTLEQSVEQFFDGFGINNTKRKTLQFKLEGPSAIQTAVVAEGSPSPTVRCEVCKVEGSFGANGPITDRPPEGISADRLYRNHSVASTEAGTCPKCKSKTMKISGTWVT